MEYTVEEDVLCDCMSYPIDPYTHWLQPAWVQTVPWQ